MKKFSWKGPMETVRPSWLTAPGLSKSTSLRAVSKCLLNTDSPRAAPTLLGSLCQCLINLMVKNFFLMLSPGLPWIPGRREQRPASPSVPPFRELRGAARSPLGLLFSRPDEPSILNLSSQNMPSQPFCQLCCLPLCASNILFWLWSPDLHTIPNVRPHQH